MRNVFDQYGQPENRLTHALACTLDSDRRLIRPFLRFLGVRSCPPVRRLRVGQQQVPGESVPRDDGEQRGLPDLCVFDDDGWAVLVEAKVQAVLGPTQLARHAATAARRGYPRAAVALIAADAVGSSRVDLQACKLEYSIVSPK